MKSGSFSLTWEEAVKIAKAGVFSIMSVSAVVLAAVAKLPAEQTPGWLGVLIPSVAAVNVIAYGLWTYIQDNRY